MTSLRREKVDRIAGLCNRSVLCCSLVQKQGTKDGRREKGEGKVVMYSRIVLVIPKGTASHCVWYNPTESDTVRYTYLRDIRVIFSMKPPRARVLPIDRCE